MLTARHNLVYRVMLKALQFMRTEVIEMREEEPGNPSTEHMVKLHDSLAEVFLEGIREAKSIANKNRLKVVKNETDQN